jgi:hypothetical protein
MHRQPRAKMVIPIFCRDESALFSFVTRPWHPGPLSAVHEKAVRCTHPTVRSRGVGRDRSISTLIEQPQSGSQCEGFRPADRPSATVPKAWTVGTSHGFQKCPPTPRKRAGNVVVTCCNSQCQVTDSIRYGHSADHMFIVDAITGPRTIFPAADCKTLDSSRCRWGRLLA